MRHIHLLNGDCAAAGWHQTGFSEPILIWRENYLCGTLPDTEDTAQFNHVRAAELHQTAPAKSEADIFTELETMHATLFSLTAADCLTLYFDYCPFDRAMLARILFLLAHRQEQPQTILIAENLIWDAAAFRLHRNSGTILTHANLAYGSDQYLNFAAGASPSALCDDLLRGRMP